MNDLTAVAMSGGVDSSAAALLLLLLGAPPREGTREP